MCKFSVFHCYCGHILYRFRDKADIGRRSRLFVPLRNNPRERTVPNRFRSLAYLVVHLNSAKVFVYSRTNRETDGKAVSIAERLLYRNAATNLPMLLCGTAFAVRCVGAFRQIDRFLSERTSLYHSFWFD